MSPPTEDASSQSVSFASRILLSSASLIFSSPRSYINRTFCDRISSSADSTLDEALRGLSEFDDLTRLVLILRGGAGAARELLELPVSFPLLLTLLMLLLPLPLPLLVVALVFAFPFTALSLFFSNRVVISSNDPVGISIVIP